MTFAAPDQTAALEKSNEDGDGQDVSVAAERPNRPVEFEEDDENGDVQRFTCSRKYRICIHRYGRYRVCRKACYFQYRVCRKLTRGQDDEGSIQDALTAPDQPAEFEDESENGDVQRRLSHRVCRRIYYFCVRHFRRCVVVCRFHYYLCIRGIVAQVAEESIQQDFAAPDQPEAVARTDQKPVEFEESDENGDVQRLTCYRKYRICIHRYGRYLVCRKACYFQYRVCRKLTRGQDDEGSIQDALTAPDQPAEFEDESENGDVQHRLSHRVCRRIYYFCVRHFRRCSVVCRFHYYLCIRGIVAQVAEESIQQDFAAPDQPEAVARTDQPVEFEESDENGDVQHRACYRKYRVCIHRYGRYRVCRKACYFQYRVCRKLTRGQDDEGSIQDALTAPDQPAEFEDESENGDVQHRLSHRVCRRIYYFCVRHFRRCSVVCRFHYYLCIRGIVAQVAEESFQKDFAAPDQPDAVERPDRHVELEEEDENAGRRVTQFDEGNIDE